MRPAQDLGGLIMAQVGIVMGSDSDMPVMAKAAGYSGRTWYFL